MKIFFDTEFQEMYDTRLAPLSIGMVREDGKELYFQICGLRMTHLSAWVAENVAPHLERAIHDIDGVPSLLGWGPKFAAMQIQDFCGESPEFWADYGAYDWVTTCQLFGTMADLPSGWPMYCHEFQQLLDEGNNREIIKSFPPQSKESLHHALFDAKYLKAKFDFLKSNS